MSDLFLNSVPAALWIPIYNEKIEYYIQIFFSICQTFLRILSVIPHACVYNQVVRLERDDETHFAELCRYVCKLQYKVKGEMQFIWPQKCGQDDGKK